MAPKDSSKKLSEQLAKSKIDDTTTKPTKSPLDPVNTYTNEARWTKLSYDGTKKSEAAFKSNAPVLKLRHLPSKAALGSLQPVTLQQLKLNERSHGKVIYLIIQDGLVFNGMHLAVRDSEKSEGLLWSLVAFPVAGGSASMTNGTIIAVKEPYYMSAPTVSEAICVHHPTDIVRVSRFDSIPKQLFPILQYEDVIELFEAGDSSIEAGNLMEAVDLYTEALARCRHTLNNDPSMLRILPLLILKRSAVYALLELNSLGLQDAEEALTLTGDASQPLSLACSYALRLGRIESAQDYFRRLKVLKSDDKQIAGLLNLVIPRVRQAAGIFDFNAIAKAVSREKPLADALTFTGDIEIRTSSLGGRGMFATKKINQGQLLLCEKALAFSPNIVLTSFLCGSFGLMEDGSYTNVRNMSFHQQLASDASTHPELIRDIFDLVAGSEYEKFDESLEVFDSYRAMWVISKNHHNTSLGRISTMHVFHDPTLKSLPNDVVTKRDNAPGLWYKTSMFNHSCVPNATGIWIGDLMVVQALHDVEADEELTLRYLEINQGHEERKQELARYEFECTCSLCKADASLSSPVKTQRELISRLEDAMVSKISANKPPTAMVVKSQEGLVRRCLKTYDPVLYKNLPYLQMVKMLFHMGHIYLGGLNIWDKASKEARAKAKACFTACVELGLRIKIVQDASTPYCELVFLKHSQQHDIGILALVGLAELAFLSKDSKGRERSLSLLACAKRLFKVGYAEDASFDRYHLHYKCKAAFAKEAAPSAPKDWDEIKAAALARPMNVPYFLQ